jgi:hypothetical protein
MGRSCGAGAYHRRKTAAAFLTFFNLRSLMAFTKTLGTGRPRHDEIIEPSGLALGSTLGWTDTGLRAARARRIVVGCARRTGPEHRCRKNGAEVVCRQLRELSSQPRRSRQGPLQADAFRILAGPLHDQHQRCLGTRRLSRRGGYARKGQQIEIGGVTCAGQATRIRASSTGAGSAKLKNQLSSGSAAPVPGCCSCSGPRQCG